MCPVPFAFNSRSPFDASLVIDVIPDRSLPKLIVSVSGSVAAVVIPPVPTNNAVCPAFTVTTDESSPAILSPAVPRT